MLFDSDFTAKNEVFDSLFHVLWLFFWLKIFCQADPVANLNEKPANSDFLILLFVCNWLQFSRLSKYVFETYNRDFSIDVFKTYNKHYSIDDVVVLKDLDYNCYKINKVY